MANLMQELTGFHGAPCQLETIAVESVKVSPVQDHLQVWGMDAVCQTRWQSAGLLHYLGWSSARRLLSVHRKELSGNCSTVSQAALIGRSQGGFVQRYRARRGLHHLFVSLLLSSTGLTCLCVPGLPGIGVLDGTKKVTEES
ncbi:hypothetical protein EYF80_038149 [Liparis tanakae]|uniref:Uncharacterized protein n=1 Tax=Liparis tanakae TaxID=230148 RepID=A0A4Z2GFG6_9TELE|nr:hypothetical protein EYF80_038149 [Liparis tanakae]